MPTLGLSMIVKNAEATLARCLDSVRGVVDEIVIADTGSTDRSQEIAQLHGARIFQIPWEKDFAKARNCSLAEVHSEWVLILDADELLDSDASESIPPLLLRPTVAGYMVRIRNYLLELNCHLWDQQAKPNTSAPPFAQQYPAYVQHENIRLFRRHPEVHFVGCIHETVGCRILELGMKMASANFMIHHLGFTVDRQILNRKYELYRELGQQKIRERPDDANAYFELGIEEFEHFRNNDAAIRLFARACKLNPRLGVAWLFYGLALTRAGMHREAIASFDQAETSGGKMHLIHEGRGDASYGLGDFSAARQLYQQALDLLGDSPSIESKLGLAEARLGWIEKGLTHLRDAIKREPTTGELYDRLMAACAWLGRVPEAAEAAEAKLTRISPEPEHFMRAASLRAEMQDWPRAIGILRQGFIRFPDSEKLQAALEEAEWRAVIAEAEAKGDEQYRQNNFDSARDCYRRALERLGDSPQIESKLGLAEVRLGRTEEGLARLRRALDRTPNSAELYDRLVGACVFVGRLAEAAEVAEAKLRKINPQADSYLRAATLRAQLGQWVAVVNLLRRGLHQFPGSKKLRAALAESEMYAPNGSLA